MTLSQLPAGRTARVDTLTAVGALRRRLLDWGLLPKTPITLLDHTAKGGCRAEIRGVTVTFRPEEARTILLWEDGT